MEGAWTAQVGTENGYKYNNKELNEDFGLNVYHYGARIYAPAMGRFTGVDPISDKFSSLSTYNYAANNPVTGIDLHGLQFVNSNDAKIYIHNGGASLKRENLSNPTNFRINTAQVVTGTDAKGRAYLTTTFPTQVGSLNFSENRLKKGRPKEGPGIVTEVTDRFSGNSQDRRAQRRLLERNGLKPGSKSESSPAPIGTSKGGKAAGAVWLVNEGLNFIANKMVSNDLTTAENQYNTFADASVNIVNTAVEKGAIPEQFQTGQMLGDLANYVFQGEFVNTYDDDTFNQMVEIAQGLIMDNGIQLNCDQCQQNQRGRKKEPGNE